MDEKITNVIWNNINDLNILTNKDHNEEDGIDITVNAQFSCNTKSINVIRSITI